MEHYQTELQALLEQYQEAYTLMRKVFTYNQIDEINFAITDGLTPKQIELFADPKLSWSDMNKLRRSIKNTKPKHSIIRSFFKSLVKHK